jgi:hypothetical protein
MSDWMLYHVWGIRGYQVAGSEKVEGNSILVGCDRSGAQKFRGF